jgi:hypothetical protein
MHFFNILDINLTYFSIPVFKCARLLVMTRYRLFRGIFFDKIFLLSIFVEKMSNVIRFSA